MLLLATNFISFSGLTRWGWIPGMAIQMAFFSFGRVILFLHRDVPSAQTSVFAANKPNSLLVDVISDPTPKPNALKCIVRVRWLVKNQMLYYEDEKLLLYIRKKSEPAKISEGSRLILFKKLQPIENFRGSTFDYKRYCRLRHLYSQVFLDETDYTILSRTTRNAFVLFLEGIRKDVVLIIKKKIPGLSGSGLLEALLVGFTDDLDPGLLKSYADTGVVHIIAISGLHLALICHILQLLLKPAGKSKTGGRVKLVVLLCCLWVYSLLSGASPSVIRAAMMFTMTLIARDLFRETDVCNTLAASAFLLLCYDPYWIWDVGFQLSYAAVLSLRLFSRPVRSWLSPQNKMLTAVWEGASVSIAAQVLTTPISIFYFHRFPSYFLIANLVAVPLSSAILIGGIFLCVLYPVPLAANYMGKILGLLIQVLNGFVRHVARLPGAVIPELSLSLTQLILLYLIIFFFCFFSKRKEKSALYGALITLCLFLLLRVFPFLTLP